MTALELAGMIGYLHEMGLLERLPRAGWLVAGIDHPESVAEHSFRTAIIGYLLASMEGADPARTALLCLFHDTQESRTGDVPLVGKRYVVTAPNPQVTADQVAGFPEEVGRAVRALTGETTPVSSRDRLAARAPAAGPGRRASSSGVPRGVEVRGLGGLGGADALSLLVVERGEP